MKRAPKIEKSMKSYFLSRIFMIFKLSVRNLNLNIIYCIPSKIISDDIKLELIFWELINDHRESIFDLLRRRLSRWASPSYILRPIKFPLDVESIFYFCVGVGVGVRSPWRSFTKPFSTENIPWGRHRAYLFRARISWWLFSGWKLDKLSFCISLAFQKILCMRLPCIFVFSFLIPFHTILSKMTIQSIHSKFLPCHI